MSEEQKPKSKTVKELIEIAFLQLLEEKPYPDISVTDIITKAGVARVSYYRNFSSISDVRESISERMANSIITELVPLFDTKDDVKLRSFIENTFRRLSRESKGFNPSIEPNRGLMFSSVEEKISKLEQDKSLDSIPGKYGRIAKFTMINEIGKKWIADGKKEPLEDMVDYVMSVISSF